MLRSPIILLNSEFTRFKRERFDKYIWFNGTLIVLFFIMLFYWDFRVSPNDYREVRHLRIISAVSALAATLIYSRAKSRKLKFALLISLLVVSMELSAFAVVHLETGLTTGIGSILFLFMFIPIVTIPNSMYESLGILLSVDVIIGINRVLGLTDSYITKVSMAYAFTGTLFSIALIYILNNIIYLVYEEYKKHEKYASEDFLTKTLNRRAFYSENEKMLKRLKPDESILYLVVDIDNLKRINDNYGHEAGDEAIHLAASTFASVFEENSLIARMGGDEFLIAKVFDSKDEGFPERICQKFINEVNSRHYVNRGEKINISVSAGGSVVDGRKSFDSIKDVIYDVDNKLLTAKKNGKNMFVLLQEDIS